MHLNGIFSYFQTKEKARSLNEHLIYVYELIGFLFFHRLRIDST